MPVLENPNPKSTCSTAAALAGCARILTFAVITALISAAPAAAQKLKGTAVLAPNPSGDVLDAVVTFDLPRSAWIGSSWFIIPDLTLIGEHSCTIRGAHTQHWLSGEPSEGNMRAYARLNKGRKLGSVFVAMIPRNPENSLFNAGCDGDPNTIDKFQGNLGAIYAAPSLYLGLALKSTLGHPDGLTLEAEVREFFGINPSRTQIRPKLLEFHGAEMFNRGGSASGVASARIVLRFDS